MGGVGDDCVGGEQMVGDGGWMNGGDNYSTSDVRGVRPTLPPLFTAEAPGRRSRSTVSYTNFSISCNIAIFLS